jgi:benzoyl-CoA reductase/2-hydroxyglutaryl-CoA dehydratase subunit BcrC/BadD/HgdB
MWESLTVQEVVEIAKDPHPSLREWKAKTGRPIIGSTLADVPEEIIYAFGLLPSTIIGTPKPLKRAPSLLPDNACSLARSSLELILSYEGDIFDGYVLPQVCDTTQHLSDIWRIHTPDKYFESFLAPRQLDRDSAAFWTRKEIERLIDSLERFSGRRIARSDIERSIRVHNENKRLLLDLYELKRRSPLTLTNKAFFSMIRLSMQVDKEEMNETLRRLKDELEEKGDGDFKRVLLAGITVAPMEVFDLFDELWLNVVADTLVTGSRYLEGIVDEKKDPVDALVERHLRRSFFSPIHRDVFEGERQLKRLFEEVRPSAVVYAHLEFCESEEYDLPDLKAAMKDWGIPMHVLETEFQTTSLSRERTRLEAFFESLKEKGYGRQA